MNRKTVGFAILNYCTWEETLKCASRIDGLQSKYSKMMCVVDNNSPETPSDKVVAELRKMSCHIIFSKENRGYNAGNNIGLSYLLQHKCDYYVVINSDVIMEDGSIDLLANIFDRNKSIGIVGPIVIEKGKQVFYGCNYKKQVIDIFLTTTVLSKFFEKRCQKLHDYRLAKQIDVGLYKVFSVSGCCFMMSKSCCEKLYPLDDTCMLYNEESMLGCRAEDLGINTVVCTDAIVDHQHGLSTRKDKSGAYIERTRSDIYYISKYLKCSNMICRILYMCRKITFNIKMCLNSDFNTKKKQFPLYKQLIPK